MKNDLHTLNPLKQLSVETKKEVIHFLLQTAVRRILEEKGLVKPGEGTNQ